MTDLIEALRNPLLVTDERFDLTRKAADEIERLRTEKNRPRLGLATTRELLDELSARIELHALGGLDYRTVDGETFAYGANAALAGKVQP